MEFLWVLVPIVSGLVYTTSGHFKGWFQAWRNEKDHSFDFKKMSKNAVIGVVIGVTMVVIQPVSGDLLGSDFAIPAITNFSQFVAGVLASMGPVMLIDKWLLAAKS